MTVSVQSRSERSGNAALRTGRPRDPEVDKAILSTALRLLAEHGYAELTMDRVASRAGVGKASLYRRWPTKEALVLDALASYTKDAQPDVPDTGSLRRDMLIYLRAIIRHRREHSAAAYALAGEALTNERFAEAFRRGVADMMLTALRTILARAVSRGELPPSADIDLLACLPLALLHHLRVLLGEPVDERQAKRIVDQFFSAAPPAPGAPSAPGATPAPSAPAAARAAGDRDA